MKSINKISEYVETSYDGECFFIRDSFEDCEALISTPEEAIKLIAELEKFIKYKIEQDNE